METINAEQCASLLGCTQATVEELSRKGDLPGLKFGKGWIFVKADLLQYLAEKARKEAEERKLDGKAKSQTFGLARVAKPRRAAPPALPIALPQGQRPGSLHSVAP